MIAMENDNYYYQPVKLQANGSWTFTIQASDDKFPSDNFCLATSKSRGLLSVGGTIKDPTYKMLDSVYQLTNGVWTRLSLKLKDPVMLSLGRAIVTDDDTKLITLGGQE